MLLPFFVFFYLLVYKLRFKGQEESKGGNWWRCKGGGDVCRGVAGGGGAKNIGSPIGSKLAESSIALLKIF